MFHGAAPVRSSSGPVRGDFVSLGSQRFYRIANYDRMEPFFISVVSSSDHWMFLSSHGGLTAGRQNSDHALFPYTTEDRIHDGSDHTGTRTILRVAKNGRLSVWEPFSRRCGSLYAVSRTLSKSVSGNQVMFEEVNHDLELVFRTTWMSSDRFGFVKRSELENTAGESATVELLDGIENILPWGVEEAFQTQFSCLADAYKQNELEPETGLATFALSSIPGDSAEPAEALRATVSWSTCSPTHSRLVSSVQLDSFRLGDEVRQEQRVCGRRGAYFVHRRIDVGAGGQQDWLIVADVGYGASEIAALKRTLSTVKDVKGVVLDDVSDGTRRLTNLVACADGLQLTGDTLASHHHFSNVLFNVMRGGLFESGYAIPMDDLKTFIQSFNVNTFERHEDLLDAPGDECERHRLLEQVRAVDDPELVRLVSEYLPLSFSRRHGDPSRPWNRFSVNVKHRNGTRLLDYEGNWRDIFQNWEALCLSFPGYLDGVISKFVNTSTADGHNPYRIAKSGYEWEAPSPGESWAHFGYWGDHQLIYLLKFLEMSRSHRPGQLEQLLADRIFVYADVPYDIKPYQELLADPRNSIAYNVDREERIAARVEAIGFDGRYLTDPTGVICRANLAEKLLVPLLAKTCTFVPGAGFWLNTQRPEWNDANNALAGYGASVVTLCYARRYVSFCLELLAGLEEQDLELHTEVARWLEGLFGALEDHGHVLEADEIGDADRKSLLDDLARVGDGTRFRIYTSGLHGGTVRKPVREVVAFLELARGYFDQTIRLNRRDDGLYHSYNVLGIGASKISIRHLGPMLEGQVAVLSSGTLGSREALSVLDALRRSELYRRDQHSYLLYPDRKLPSFLDKNTIPPSQSERSHLFSTLVADGNTDLVEMDVDGQLHFNSLFKNVRDVDATLDELEHRGYRRLVDEERGLVREIFESVFDHTSFTGRSGAFYGYEGLGCIYWHMVSKLQLAVQECCLAAADDGDDAFEELAMRYDDIRAGLGFNKTPQEYGAFPTDAYSHTPGFAGARQPGMTGQVKEQLITRLGELGLFVRDGRIVFDPVLLRGSELLSSPEVFEYTNLDGQRQRIELDSGTLVFTYCRVPIVYRLAQCDTIIVRHLDGTTRELDGTVLDRNTSHEIFTRSGNVVRIDVHLGRALRS